MKISTLGIGVASLVLSAAAVSAQGYVQPIFSNPGGEQKVNDLVKRVQNLGLVTPNTGKIAETLDRGFPDITQFIGSPSQARSKPAANGILFAGNDPKDPPSDVNPIQIQPAQPAQPAQPGQQPPQGNNQNSIFPPNEFKQTIDAMTSIFKMQGDLIRSIDLSAFNQTINNPPSGMGPVVASGRTGFELAPVSPELAQQLKLPDDQGLLIKRVFPKTPAEQAGYKANDILMEFNGRKVPATTIGFMDLNFRFVRNHTPITGVVIRQGDRTEVGPMTLTDRRVTPALPGERPLDLPQIIQVAPGINGATTNTIRVPEIRTIQRGNGIVDIILVDPNKR